MATASSPIPARVARLPLSDAGYPVPWFVAYVDGVPDFRVMDGHKLVRAVREGRCWVCGDPLGAFRAFVVGPMCAVNHTSAEPPSHRDCAVYSATHCPFLNNPKKRRRESHKPDAATDPAGEMIRRNPGVALVWVTRGGYAFPVGDGVLFNIGEPTETLWFAEGRPATRAEVMASMESGLPLLFAVAEDDGPKAMQMLERQYAAALELVPT